MKNFQKKEGKKSIKHSPLVLFSLLCVVLVFMYNMIGLIEKTHETAKKKDIISNQINTLKERESSLSTSIERLNTDIGTEETLRDKYQLVKPGEKMVVIVDQENSNDENTENSVPKNQSWIKRFFKNLFN